MKEHEEEIVAWVHSKYPKIETIQFDWNTLKVVPVSSGVSTSYYNLSIRARFNNIPETVIFVDFTMDKEDSIPELGRIAMNHPPGIHRGKVLYDFE